MKSWLVTNVSLNFVPRQNEIRSQDHVNTVPSSSSKYKQRRSLTVNLTEKNIKKMKNDHKLGKSKRAGIVSSHWKKNQFHYKVS